jgi:hypothetical protein
MSLSLRYPHQYPVCTSSGCKGEGSSLLDSLHSFLKTSNLSAHSLSQIHSEETTDNVLYIVHVAKETQKGVCVAVHEGDMTVRSVARVG